MKSADSELRKWNRLLALANNIENRAKFLNDAVRAERVQHVDLHVSLLQKDISAIMKELK